MKFKLHTVLLLLFFCITHAEDYTVLPKSTDLMWIQPLALINQHRFSIMAKYIFANHWDLQVESDWAKELYREHLTVWYDNFNTWDGNKNSFQDWVTAFENTLESVKTNGFDPQVSFVPLGRRSIVNGEHRTASSLYFNKKVACKKVDHKGWSQTSDFFKKRGLEEKYLDAMALQYAQLKNNTYIVILFPPAYEHDVEVRDALNAYGTIIYEKEVSLTNNGPIHLISHLYYEQYKDYWGQEEHIKNAKNRAKNRFPKNASGPLRAFLWECPDIFTSIECKHRIREICDVGNFSVHINDDHDETVMTAKMLFNQNSIDYMNRSSLEFYDHFENTLDTYKALLQTNHLDESHFCVIGGGALAACGIRKTGDIDFISYHTLNESLDGLHADIESHNNFARFFPTTLDDIIFNPCNHFYYKGCKFAALPLVQHMKKERSNWFKENKKLKNAEKDLLDAASIEQFLE